MDYYISIERPSLSTIIWPKITVFVKIHKDGFCILCKAPMSGRGAKLRVDTENFT